MKLRVNLNPATFKPAKSVFQEKTKNLIPDLDAPHLEKVWELVNDLHTKYLKVFGENSSIFLQVERFATLYSIEKYLLNKFGLKSLCVTDTGFAKKLKKQATDRLKSEADMVTKKNLEDKLKGASEVIDSGQDEKTLTEKEIKNIFYDKTQKFSNDGIIQYVDQQCYSKPCRILKLRFYYRDELLKSETSIQELTEKINRNGESITNLVLRYDIDIEWNMKIIDKKTTKLKLNYINNPEQVQRHMMQEVALLETKLKDQQITGIAAETLKAMKMLNIIWQFKDVYTGTQGVDFDGTENFNGTDGEIMGMGGKGQKNSGQKNSGKKVVMGGVNRKKSSFNVSSMAREVGEGDDLFAHNKLG